MFDFLDNPRQALWNIPASLAKGDFAGALPGLAGLGVGAGLAATGLGLPLAMLGGSLAGGLGQGIGKATGSASFDAPTPSHLIEALGMDPEEGVGMHARFAAGLLGDPLTYAAVGMGAPAFGSRAKAVGTLNPAEQVMNSSTHLQRVLGANPDLAQGAREIAAQPSPLGSSSIDRVLEAQDAAFHGLQDRNQVLGNTIARMAKNPGMQYSGIADPQAFPEIMHMLQKERALQSEMGVGPLLGQQRNITHSPLLDAMMRSPLEGSWPFGGPRLSA